MTLFLLPDSDTEWVDSEHPERGSIFARKGVTENEISAEWSAAFISSPEQHRALQTEAIRVTRDRLLRETDWTQLPDAPVDKARWAIYRQELRDLPAQTEPAWPKRPDDTDIKAAERELDRAARTVLFDGKNT